MKKIAALTAIGLALLGGCSGNDGGTRDNPDGQVAFQDGNPDRSVPPQDGNPDRTVVPPDGGPDRSVDPQDGNPDRSVAPQDASPGDGVALRDGSPDQRTSPVACQDQPTEGEACEPLPAGQFCRPGSCTGGCLNECRCSEGKWRCSVSCRDNFSSVPIDCGKPPLCREICLSATVLPDGGLSFPTDGDYSSQYKYRVYFRPTDMSTLSSDKELGLTVVSGPPLDKSWLQDLAGRVSLRTWPEMEDVPATSSAVDSPNWAGVVTIKPTSKLADRWYAVRLSAPPFWIETPSAHVAPDGSYVARFSLGSEPKVASVTFAGGASKHRLYIYTSEPVSAQTSPAGIVEVRSAGAVVACSDVGFTAGKAMNSLSFDCPTLTAFPDQISIGAGLSSATGVALAPVTIAKSDLTLSNSCGTDCWSGVLR